MAKRQSLNPLREQLSILVERANAQVKAINKAHKKSRAVDEAKRTILLRWRVLKNGRVI